jgi:V8-like Glu-specific endopeptidase
MGRRSRPQVTASLTSDPYAEPFLTLLKGFAVRAETIAEQLFFTTCRIEGGNSSVAWVGTGFTYAVETESGTAHFLVTNKHVLDSAESVTIRMIRGNESGEPLLGLAAEITIQQFNPSIWTGHPHPAIDVAVMPLGQVLSQMQLNGAPPFFRSVDPNISLTAEQEGTLDAIEEVTFIGYPSGLYDTKNYLPILRRGTTATPIDVDYEGVPAFLIDASVFPGSSGSPVFIADKGIYQTRNGSTVVGSRLIFIGILAAVHTRQVQGSVDVLPSSKLVTAFPEPIDLGIVYKARCVDDCIQLVLQNSGLKQIKPKESIETSTEPSAADNAIAQEQ